MTLSRSFFKIGPARLFVHFAVLLIVIIWLIPTLGIFVSALRDKDQIVVSGWWTAFSGSSRTVAARLGAADLQKPDGPAFVISGNVLEARKAARSMPSAPRSLQPSAYKAGETADLGDGVSLLVNADGSYRYMKNAAFGPDDGGRRVYISAATRPLHLQNYKTVLTGEGIGRPSSTR
jgi:alpha-glucoside transport system permease protein